MNRSIRQLAGALIVLYIVLFAALNYWQVGRTEELASEPSNTRALIRQFDSPRGEIVTADGIVVARSVQALGSSDVKYVRNYPTKRSVRQRHRLLHVRPRLHSAREDRVRRVER